MRDREHQVIAKDAHLDDLGGEVRYRVEQGLPPATESVVAVVAALHRGQPGIGPYVLGGQCQKPI